MAFRATTDGASEFFVPSLIVNFISNRILIFPFSGLYQDDLHDYTDPVNIEALRRLPPDEYDQHTFRVIRASQLELTKQYVPENERPTYEEVMFMFNFSTLNFLYSHIFFVS